MKTLLMGILISSLSFSVSVHAQSPYAGQESRQIKALSRQQVRDYLDGKGMGYAKAAELNHYPGPRHVLDLAKELGLTQEQKARTQLLFDSMKARAVDLGKQLVEKEKELDRQFSNASISDSELNRLVSDIGALQARIRYVHLSAHLNQKELLSKEQIQRYDQLRGYGSLNSGKHAHSH